MFYPAQATQDMVCKAHLPLSQTDIPQLDEEKLCQELNVKLQ